MAEQQTNTKPTITFHSGNVRISLWENQGENGTYHSIKFSRFYKDENDEWRHTDSFHERDLLDLAALAEEAHRRIRIKDSEVK